MASRIFHSKKESDHYRISIGRGSVSEADLDDCMTDIVESGFDLVRIKVPAGQYSVLLELEKLGLPLYFAGAVVNYSIHLNKLSLGEYTVDGLEFELYDGAQSKTVRDIVRRSLQEDPIGFYKTPYLKEFISKADEIAYLEDHFAGDFVGSDDHLLFLLRTGKDYWGFVTMIIDGDSVNSSMAAIYPEFRNKGGLKNIKIKRGNFAIENNIAYTVNGCRIDNIGAQHVYEKFGMKKTGVDLIYHILPFRSVPAIRSVRVGDLKLLQQHISELIADNTFVLSRSFQSYPEGSTKTNRQSDVKMDLVIDHPELKLIRTSGVEGDSLHVYVKQLL